MDPDYRYQMEGKRIIAPEFVFFVGNYIVKSENCKV